VKCVLYKTLVALPCLDFTPFIEDNDCYNDCIRVFLLCCFWFGCLCTGVVHPKWKKTAFILQTCILMLNDDD